MTVTRDDFEYWLADMDDALERFVAGLPEQVSRKLDFSLGSLDVLEQWTLEKYPNVASTRGQAESSTLDGLARYVGETFRRELGGRWEIRLDGLKMP